MDKNKILDYQLIKKKIVRISLQSETTVEGVADTFKGLKLKLVIFD